MLKIGEFSKLSRISIRMLRYYDEMNLLTPAEVDSFTAYRYYREEQLLTAGQITELRNMGFGCSAIREILAHNDKTLLIHHLHWKQIELEEQAAVTAAQLHRLQTTLNRLREDEANMSYSVKLKEIPERPVVSVRQVISNYGREGDLWQLLMAETAPLKVVYADPRYAIARFHDKEFKECDVDVEVQMAVQGTYPDTEHAKFFTDPAVTVASVTFAGSYDQMSFVYEAIAAWIRDNGYVMNGTAFNIYHVSPNETANPDDYVTEVCFPVDRAH